MPKFLFSVVFPSANHSSIFIKMLISRRFGLIARCRRARSTVPAAAASGHEPAGRLDLIHSTYNTAIISAYKDALCLRSDNETFKSVLSVTDAAIVVINKSLQADKKAGFSYQQKGLMNARTRMEALLLKSLHIVQSAEEMKGIAAAMHIVQPQSVKLWMEFDRLAAANVRQHGLDFAMLAAYAVDNAQRMLRMDRSLILTPAAAVDLLYELRDPKKNAFDQFTWAAPTSSTGSRQQVHGHRGVELLGLQMALIAAQPWARRGMKDTCPKRRKLLLDLVTHAVKVLHSVQVPVKLMPLQQIWEVAARVDIHDTYMLYKLLFQQATLSITTEPLQIVHHEEKLCSLFESMVANKFKSSELLGRIFDLVQLRGMSVERHGVRMFNTLVQLDSFAFAVYVLENVMKFSSQKLETVFSQSGDETFADDAKKTFFGFLADRCKKDITGECAPDHSTTMNLMMMLLFFGKEGHNSPRYQLLRQLECNLANKISALSMDDCHMLYHGYALANRLCPAMIAALDQQIAARIDVIPVSQQAKIVWFCARLNHKPDYLPVFVKTYFNSIEGVSRMHTYGYAVLTKMLWSLSVLHMLTPEQFLSVHRLLTRYVKDNMDSSVVSSWMCQQLRQVCVEMSIHASSMQDEEAKQHILTATEQLMNAVKGTTAWKFLQRSNKADIVSSFTHRDASSVLSEMGITHENEKMLDNGYIADVFMPASVARRLPPGSSKGVVIEFDGPQHFESYTGVSPLLCCACLVLTNWCSNAWAPRS